MNTRCDLRLLITVSVLTGLLGCASSVPDPRLPEDPGPLIEVDGATMPAIGFFKVRTDIPGGRLLGWHYEGIEDSRVNDYRWDESFDNVTTILNEGARGILEEAGYRMTRGEEGEVLMKGIMRKVSYNSFQRKVSFTQAEMEVRWQLFLPGEDKPFRTFASEGAGRVDNIDSGAMVHAFENALRRLLADPEFPGVLRELD